MRFYILFIGLLLTVNSFAQKSPVDKVFIMEGIVADRETLKAISFAILYNEDIGSITTTDEKGYFKIVVPFERVKYGNYVTIRASKYGYKSMGAGFGYTTSPTDTSLINNNNRVIWNNDVRVF